MKEYILLYCSRPTTYLPLVKEWDNNNSLSNLFSMLFGDFRPWDNDFLKRDVNLYNANYMYHDFENKLLYIGFGEWLINEDIDGPSWEEFSHYVNESNSCKMSVDNYLEFRNKWVQLKKDLPPFALIYRDNFDWIDCKGFDTQEAMEAFVKNFKDEIVH